MEDCGTGNGDISSRVTLVTLPDIVLDNVFSYMSYDEISKLRSVCLLFNRIGQRFLNRGFTKLQEYQKSLYKDIKSHLPRRESERHEHALSRHMEVLTSVGTRLCLLDMTYSKYMKDQACCFIPGKVLDEAYRLMRIIQTESTIPRSYDVIQELRDISGMAMEHFEENIIPTLKTNRFSALGCLASSAGISNSDAVRKMTSYRTNASNAVNDSRIPFPYRSLSVSFLPHARSQPSVSGQLEPVAGPSGVLSAGPAQQHAANTRSVHLNKLSVDISGLRTELYTTKRRMQKTSARCLKLRAEVQSHRYKWVKQVQQNSELKQKLAEQKKFSESLAARLEHMESLVDITAAASSSTTSTSPASGSVATPSTSATGSSYQHQNMAATDTGSPCAVPDTQPRRQTSNNNSRQKRSHSCDSDAATTTPTTLTPRSYTEVEDKSDGGQALKKRKRTGDIK